MSDLRAFVQDLSENPHKVAELKSDPERVMSDANLSDEHKELIRTGDQNAIRSEIEGAQARDGEGGGVIVVVVVL